MIVGMNATTWERQPPQNLDEAGVRGTLEQSACPLSFPSAQANHSLRQSK